MPLYITCSTVPDQQRFEILIGRADMTNFQQVACPVQRFSAMLTGAVFQLYNAGICQVGTDLKLKAGERSTGSLPRLGHTSNLRRSTRMRTLNVETAMSTMSTMSTLSFLFFPYLVISVLPCIAIF
jgi:hypothetical protein